MSITEKQQLWQYRSCATLLYRLVQIIGQKRNQCKIAWSVWLSQGVAVTNAHVLWQELIPSPFDALCESQQFLHVNLFISISRCGVRLVCVLEHVILAQNRCLCAPSSSLHDLFFVMRLPRSSASCSTSIAALSLNSFLVCFRQNLEQCTFLQTHP